MRFATKRPLQRTVRILAAVPIVMGSLTLLAGTRTVSDRGDPTPSLESEFHFFGAWWLGAGLYLFSLADRIEERTREVRVFAALLFLAACGRLVAIADAGWPEAPHIALMIIEFGLAVLLVVWQGRVARASRLQQPR